MRKIRKTKIFTSGNSQAVRIPVGFQLRGVEVEIIKKEHEIILREIPQNLGNAFTLFTKFSDDFFAEGRKDTPPTEKGAFLMVLKYLLDTNICIYITKQKPLHILSKFEELVVGEAGMSTVTYGELYFGAQKSQHPKKNGALLEELASLIPPLPISTETAIHYGHIRSTLEKSDTPIGNNDLWIAAHALTLNIILVTNNLKEFKRIPHLKLENWANPGL